MKIFINKNNYILFILTSSTQRSRWLEEQTVYF